MDAGWGKDSRGAKETLDGLAAGAEEGPSNHGCIDYFNDCDDIATKGNTEK